MNKWLKRLMVIVLATCVLLTTAWLWNDRRTPMQAVRYVANEELQTIRSEWPGTPVDESGSFVNYEYPTDLRINNLIRWRLSSNPFADEKKRDTARLEVRDPEPFLAGDQDGILWLGHASFYMRLDGVSFLFDPIFGRPPFVKRFVDVPSPLRHLRKVDYVLLSHDHRDHTDEATLRQIAEKFPSATFIGGLRMEDLFNDWKTPGNRVSTAGWFQRLNLPAGVPEVFFVPVRHWSRRGLFDTNRRLWGGYVVRGRRASVYFGGDSGYGRHYRDVGELFPAIDYLLIGIGAYEPRWFMEQTHNSPADALKAFADLGAKTMIPMHFGTFDMSDEPPSAPLRELDRAAAASGLTDRIKVLTINESFDLPIDKEKNR